MNNKKPIFIIIGVFVVAAVSIAITFLLRGKDIYLNALPKDATAIVRLDVIELLNEADLTVGEQVELFQHFLRSDLSKLGVDAQEPIYAFVATSGNFGLLAAVADNGDLRERCQEWYDQGRASQLEKQRGLYWVTLENQWLMAFDSDRALVMGPAAGAAQETLRNEMAQLLAQDKDNSGVQSALFAALANHEDALTAVVAPEILPREMRKLLRGVKVYDQTDALLLLNFEADDNEIEIEANILAQSKGAREELHRMGQLLRPIKGALAKYARNDATLWMTFNLKGCELLDILRKDLSIRTSLVALNLIFDADNILRAIDGDLAVEMSNAAALSSGKGLAALQNLNLTAQIVNADFLSAAPTWGNALVRVQTLSESDFAMHLGETPTYFGVKDNTLYFGSSQGLSEGDNSYLRKELDDIRDSRFYATVQIPQLTQQLGVAEMVPQLLIMFQRMEIDMKRPEELHLTFAAPEGTNVLRELLTSW